MPSALEGYHVMEQPRYAPYRALQPAEDVTTGIPESSSNQKNQRSGSRAAVHDAQGTH